MDMTAVRMVLLAALAIPIACTQAQNDCKRNPELPCYEGGPGSSGSGASGGGSGASGGSSGASGGSSGASGGGGSGLQPLGAPCVTAAECTSSLCVDGVCCDTACDGLCEACNPGAAPGTCSPFPVGEPDTTVAGDKICGVAAGGCGATPGYCACEDGIQNGAETDVDCGGSTCNLCGVGDTCGTGADCISGYCEDGFCCGSTCGSLCVACNLPGKEGLCSLVPANTPDPQCSPGEVCNGLGGLCALELGGSCQVDNQCASGQCEGAVCFVCASDNNCPNGKVCVDGACYYQAQMGEPCISNDACNGFCVDGICCEVPCDGLCMACHYDYTSQPTGTCAPILAGYDPHNECSGPGGSAFCSGALDGNGNSACATP